jgi:hypothetical protein
VQRQGEDMVTLGITLLFTWESCMHNVSCSHICILERNEGCFLTKGVLEKGVHIASRNK